ncbi:MAG: metal-dependent hydrolase [Actinobacteria bacterium]|nr:metal-dependent hydrolase [Actinomycetota bacterium]
MTTQLTWLGHASFRLDTPSGARVYVDPWLSGPTCPEGEREPERADLVVISHGHSDHVGESVMLNQRFGCPVIAAVEVRGWLTAQGAADDGMTQSLNKGGSTTVAGVRVTLTTANHSSSGPNGEYLGEPCGIVLGIDGGPTVYFAGDTNVFGDMALIRRLYAPDVAVLPIGDHFTMGPAEAAVALELLGTDRCVPCHYGTFPLLTGTPDALRALAPGVEVLAPAPGETISL